MKLGALILVCGILLSACALLPSHSDETPRFALPPTSLGHELTLAQRLRFSFFGTTRTLDAWLEADAQSVRLAALVGGQTAMSFDWNGSKLDVRKADWMPEAMDAAQVLSDLQFVFWPVTTLRASLPTGWQVVEQTGHRELRQGERIVVTADLLTVNAHGIPAHIHLENKQYGYTLDIDSAEQ